MKPFSLDEYIKNPSRNVVTRDGRPVRIVCTDAMSGYPIIALVRQNEDTERICKFTQDGTFVKGVKNNVDLFFSQEKHEGWVNVYLINDARTGCSFEAGPIYDTKEEALKNKQSKSCFSNISYTDTVHIEWEE